MRASCWRPSLDYTSALTGVAQAAVPRIADWCIVELQEESLQGHPSLAVHVDPTKNADLRELGRRVRRLNLNHGIPSVVREGKSELYRSITPEMISVGLRADPELAELYAKTGLVSSMVVPITANGRVLGAIVLSSATPTVHYDEHDLAMAEELGRRAGLAVDNARLYRAAREADRRKDEFLAMLSHELRNPLAPIVTALDLMELRIGDACEREREIVSRQVQHLVRLVDDLFERRTRDARRDRAREQAPRDVARDRASRGDGRAAVRRPHRSSSTSRCRRRVWSSKEISSASRRRSRTS